MKQTGFPASSLICWLASNGFIFGFPLLVEVQPEQALRFVLGVPGVAQGDQSVPSRGGTILTGYGSKYFNHALSFLPLIPLLVCWERALARLVATRQISRICLNVRDQVDARRQSLRVHMLFLLPRGRHLTDLLNSHGPSRGPWVLL